MKKLVMRYAEQAYLVPSSQIEISYACSKVIMVAVQISKKSFKKRKKKKRTVHAGENNPRIGRTVQVSKRSPNLQQEISLAKSKLALISKRNAGTVELL